MNEFQPTIVAVLAVSFGLALITFVVVTTTSFVKISVVLFLVRNALGIQQVPPNLVLYGIALTLTVYVSAPIANQISTKLSVKQLEYKKVDDWKEAARIAQEPVRDYLVKFTSMQERQFFLESTKRVWPEDMQSEATTEDFAILVPSFLVSELRRAFEIGFLIYLPFITIDLVVTTILLAMGMSMVSPTILSVPFKLLLFVTIEGWSRLLHGLVLSYS